MLEVIPPWTQDLGLLLETVEAWRPSGAAPDWNPGAVLRLPFTRKLCADGKTISGAWTQNGMTMTLNITKK